MRDLRQYSNQQIWLSPSILAADFTRLGEAVGEVAAAGGNWLHLDVMDGGFVPNISFGIPVIKSLRKVSDLLFDTHLMIEHPEQYAAQFAAAGADHLTFHLESAADVQQAIDAIRAAGCTVGLSIKPDTPEAQIEPWLKQVDLVLIMTVEPGFGGQHFMAEELAKVRELRRLIAREKYAVHIEVDGGIDADTVKQAAAAGANVMVAGTAVFGCPGGVKTGMKTLLEAQKELDLALKNRF